MFPVAPDLASIKFEYLKQILEEPIRSVGRLEDKKEMLYSTLGWIIFTLNESSQCTLKVFQCTPYLGYTGTKIAICINRHI